MHYIHKYHDVQAREEGMLSNISDMLKDHIGRQVEMILPITVKMHRNVYVGMLRDTDELVDGFMRDIRYPNLDQVMVFASRTIEDCVEEMIERVES